MLERIANVVTTRRRAVIVVGLGLALALAPFGVRVPLDNSVHVWTVDDPGKAAAYRRFHEAFGSDEQVLAVVRGKTAAFRDDPTLLRFVSDLTKDLERRKDALEVEEVVSILTLARPEVEVLLDEGLGGWSDLARLRSKLTQSPLERSFRLLDLDRDLATVAVTLTPGGAEKRAALLAELATFRERAAREGREFLVAGEPIVNVSLDEGAHQVDDRYLPILIGVCVVMTLALTRSARTAALVLVPVGLSVLAMAGLVGVTGYTFNLLLVIAKPLIFVLSLATGLHFAQSYVEGLREGMDRVHAARRAFEEKTVPCLYTTTAAVYGFGSLLLAHVQPIRALGGFAAAGMIGACVLMVGPLLAALALWGPTRPPRQGPDRFGALAQSVVEWVTRRRGRATAAILGGVLLCGVGALCYQSLKVDTDSLHYFKPERPVRSEYTAIEREGLGLFAFEVVVRRADGASVTSLAVLEALRDFERAAHAHAQVTQTISFADVLADTSWRATGSDALPDPSILRDALSNEDVIVATRKLLGEGRGLEAHVARVTVLALTDNETLPQLLRDLTADFDKTARVRGLEADFTGTSPLMLATQLSLLETLGASLSGAALTIGLTLLVFVRSLRRTLLALLPNALPILLNFAFMRAAAMPLDVGTVMVSSIVLGIAVDNTIHYFFHYKRALARGEPRVQALATAARIAGRSLVLATLITVTGFLTLLLSDFAPTWRFGLLAASGLTVAVVGTIIVLPASLLIFDKN